MVLLPTTYVGRPITAAASPWLWPFKRLNFSPAGRLTLFHHAACRIAVGEGSIRGGGNQIPMRAHQMVERLRSRKLQCEMKLIPGEDHGSLKPSLVSSGLGWLEKRMAATPSGA